MTFPIIYMGKRFVIDFYNKDGVLLIMRNSQEEICFR